MGGFLPLPVVPVALVCFAPLHPRFKSLQIGLLKRTLKPDFNGRSRAFSAEEAPILLLCFLTEEDGKKRPIVALTTAPQQGRAGFLQGVQGSYAPADDNNV